MSAYVLRRATGIAQGFDFYDDAIEIEGGTESIGNLQRDGAVAVESLSRWIADQKGARLFAFLHLYEPHSPYTPPPRHQGHAVPYDGEIAYADELVGRLLDGLEKSGLYDRAIVAVTSDHGEGLGDHGEAEHGIFLYREEVHIPLIVRLPHAARAGTRVAGTVAQADLAATLLDLAGLPAAGLDGVSLKEAMSAPATGGHSVYSETLYPRYHLGWSELFAATEGRYRYVRAPRPELFDLASDGKEQRNLAAQRASVAAAMGRWLEERGAGAAASAPEEVPSDVREKLQALGYLGSTAAHPSTGSLPDPKDHIADADDLRRALALRQAGKDDDAIALFRRVLARNPRMVDAWEMLGLTLVRAERTRDGIAALRKGLAIDPLQPQIHLALARIYAIERQPDLAARHAEIAAQTDPAGGYEAAAQAVMDRGDVARAAAFARQSLAADPRRSMSHFILGVAAQKQGRCEEALASFRTAEETLAREKTTVIRNLHASAADCLARLGHNDEAEREFRAEIGAIPGSREARVGLAMLYRSQGRDEDARAVLSALVAAEGAPTADTYWTVVHTFTVLGDLVAARRWAAIAKTRFPSDSRFR